MIDPEKDKTYVIVLFKEFTDAEHSISGNYIKGCFFNKGIEDNYLEMAKTQAEDTLLFFGYEDFIPLYDQDNINAFLWPFKSAVYPNATMRFNDWLKTFGFTDIDDLSQVPIINCLVFKEIVSKNVLGKAVSRQKFGNAIVILDIDALKYNSPIVIQEQYTSQEMQLVAVKEIKQLYEWFSDNRKPQRVYVFNSKHGDKNHKAQGGSQLLTTEYETIELLKKAMGTDKESAVWLYDDNNKAYIYFENQNEIRKAFHGYHINKGDENYNNIDKDKLKKIFEQGK